MQDTLRRGLLRNVYLLEPLSQQRRLRGEIRERLGPLRNPYSILVSKAAGQNQNKID